MQNQKLKGETLLKVVGILMIIDAAFAILFSPLAAICSCVAAVKLAEAFGAAAGISIIGVIIGLIFSIIAGVINLIVGIKGVKNCNKQEMAGNCFKWGIAALVISVICAIISWIAYEFSVSSLFSFVLPILFIIGAYFNKTGSTNIDFKEFGNAVTEGLKDVANDAKNPQAVVNDMTSTVTDAVNDVKNEVENKTEQ